MHGYGPERVADTHGVSGGSTMGIGIWEEAGTCLVDPSERQPVAGWAQAGPARRVNPAESWRL